MAEVLVIAAGLAPEIVDRSEEALEAMGDVLEVCDKLLQEAEKGVIDLKTAAEKLEVRQKVSGASRVLLLVRRKGS